MTLPSPVSSRGCLHRCRALASVPHGLWAWHLNGHLLEEVAWKVPNASLDDKQTGMKCQTSDSCPSYVVNHPEWSSAREAITNKQISSGKYFKGNSGKVLEGRNKVPCGLPCTSWVVSALQEAVDYGVPLQQKWGCVRQQDVLSNLWDHQQS